MSNEIDNIVNKARKYQKVDTVMRAINHETLYASHKYLASKKAVGVDGVTKRMYSENLENNLKELERKIFNFSYRPKPVRKVEIPKPGTDKKRPLGIPSYEDKIVQCAMAKILNSIYEEMFLDCSYGFRENRNCHQAIAKLDNCINGKKTNYILEVDIKGFFDNMDHEWIIKFLEYRIADKTFIRYIKRILKAGIMKDGKVSKSKKGAPQGGIISPIIGNIYLHFAVDKWFGVETKENNGYSEMVRYADDITMCFQYEKEAIEMKEKLKERLQKFGLEMSEEKTKIVEFGRCAKNKKNTFEFLGFLHYNSSNRNNGKYRMKRKTSKKKLNNKLKEMTKWFKKNMHVKVSVIIEKLNVMLRGYYNYYNIVDNTENVRSFRNKMLNMLYRVLNRRSQKNRYTYKYFREIIGDYIITATKVVDIVAMSLKLN